MGLSTDTQHLFYSEAMVGKIPDYTYFIEIFIFYRNLHFSSTYLFFIEMFIFHRNLHWHPHPHPHLSFVLTPMVR